MMSRSRSQGTEVTTVTGAFCERWFEQEVLEQFFELTETQLGKRNFSF